MAWTFAPYIPLINVADRPVGYVWKEGSPLFYYREDPRFENRVTKICARGVVALSAGFAEWVAARWPELAESALLPEIEAVRAGIIDWRYLRPPTTDANAPTGEACRGPENGPICDVFFALANIAARAQRSASLVAHCSALSQLAIHVLPDANRFKEWRRSTIERLAELHPRDKGAPLGPPIPREALDPDYPYEPGLANDLLAQFLPRLDPANNPFLHSADEMRQLGFQGTPYSLD